MWDLYSRVHMLCTADWLNNQSFYVCSWKAKRLMLFDNFCTAFHLFDDWTRSNFRLNFRFCPHAQFCEFDFVRLRSKTERSMWYKHVLRTALGLIWGDQTNFTEDARDFTFRQSYRHPMPHSEITSFLHVFFSLTVTKDITNLLVSSKLK